MKNTKMVIVVGAGASREVNLPTGQELKEKIAGLLDIRFSDGYRRSSGDHLIHAALELHLQRQVPPSRDINPHLHASWRIRDAMPQAISIDNFIDAHQGASGIEFCGKLAIVRSILDAEKNSLLYADPRQGNARIKFEYLGKSWFNNFFQLLTENCRVSNIMDRVKSVMLIVFNYDRCIEHFLFNSLKNYYGITDDQAAEIVLTMNIYHPYGTVGCLPWQKRNNTIGFGEDPSPDQLINLSKGIKTFTEGTDPGESEIVAIRQGVQNADMVLFMGFAFHRLNMDLLFPLKTGKNKSQNAINYFATAKGISSSDCELIRDELMKLAGARYQNVCLRNDLECNKLLHEYWRSLSFR